MSTKTNRSDAPRPIDRRGFLRAAAGVATVGALATAGIVAERRATDRRVNGPERAEVGEWLKGDGPEIAPVVIVVDSTVNTRTTPDVLNSDKYGGGDDNSAGIIDEPGTVVVVRNPLVHDGFFGFVDPKNPINEEEFRGLSTDEDRARYLADHTAWVAQFVGDDLVREYEDPRATPEQLDGAGEPMRASLNSNGQYLSPFGTEAASAQIMSAESAEFFMAAFKPYTRPGN